MYVCTYVHFSRKLLIILEVHNVNLGLNGLYTNWDALNKGRKKTELIQTTDKIDIFTELFKWLDHNKFCNVVILMICLVSPSRKLYFP